MAGPDTRTGYKVRLDHSIDGGLVFVKACGITTTRMTFTLGIAEALVQDCSEDFPIPEYAREGTTKDLSLAGSGLYAREFEQRLFTSHMTAAKDVWRVRFKDGMTIICPMIIQQLEFGGVADDTGMADVSIALVAAGRYTYTPSA